MSDIQCIDDRSSNKLVKTDYLSKHSYKFESKSGLIQTEDFQISEDEINSSLNQKLYFSLFHNHRYFRTPHITFTEKCELVIKPKKSSQIPYNMLEYDLYENNSIRIFGLKGTGKTTLVKKLLTEAFDHITARYIFYFDCNEIDLNKETTLLEFLAENIYINSREKTLDYEIIKALEHSNRVTIVIDDAMSIKSKEDYRRWPTYSLLCFGNDDNYSGDSTDSSFEDDYYSSTDSSSDLKQINFRNTGHKHLSRILNGKIMPKSKKIVTCLLNSPLKSLLRYSKLDDENILLVGLNHDSQLEIFKSIGEKNQQNFEKHLQSHPGLLDFCYMPDICFLTGHCINELLISTLQTSLPISLTDIFVYLLDKLVSDSSLFDFNLLTEICDLSWHGIKNRKTEFDLTNIRKKSLNWQYLKNLSANMNKATLFLFKFSSPNTFHFSISLAQEFCAAIYLIFMMPFDEFKMLISDKSKLQIFDLYNYQNKHIARFVFGLCKDVTLKHVLEINSSFSHSIDKMSFLYNIVCEKKSQIKILDNTFLQQLAWVYELHNHSYTQKLASRLSNELRVDCEFCQEDICAFFYVLEARHEPISITALSNDNFVDDSWELFFTLARSSSIKMLSLDLSWNKFGNKGATILSHCLNNVKQLILQGFDITAPGVESISNKICQLDEPMLSLDLSWNEFGNKGAVILSQCLKNVKQLILQGCAVTKPGVEAISNKISELDEPMLSLDLSWNEFGNEGATILSQCLNNVKQLILQDCEIIAPGVESISNKICQLDEPMEFVNLYDNKVGNRGFTAIFSCLHSGVKLTTGSYFDLELTMKGIKKTLSAAENTPYPLLELNIDYEYLMEEEAKREAQKYDSNIWIQNNQVPFKVESVKERAEDLTQYKKQVESDSSSNESIDPIDGEEKNFSFGETNSDCFSRDDPTELYETAQEFPHPKRVEEVKAYLLNEAERLSKPHRPLFLQNTIHNIDLDLSTKVKSNLSTTSEKHDDDLLGIGDLYKIFQTASNEMKQYGNFTNDKDKSKFVFLVGNAGSGKTTIIKALLHKYFQDKTLCGFDFAFFLRYLDSNRNCDYNYLEFLIKNFPYAWIKNNAMCNVVLKQLENEKTCLLIDDLNLSNLSLQKLSAKCDRNENHVNAQTLLWDILLGKLFPNSLKFVTFRPLQFLEFMKLPDNLRPSPEIVYISGVNQNSQVKIFQSVCSSNFDLTVTYLTVYPQLHLFCNILANNLAVVQSINGHLQHSTVNIKSSSKWNICIPLTSVFVSSLLMITRNSGIQYSLIDLSDAVKLAWRQIADQLTVLETNKVLSYHRHDIINVFLQICVAKEDSTCYELTFPSIVFDCFIAMYLLYFHESFDSEIASLLDHKSFSHNIIKFVFGLCNSFVKVYLKKLLPPCGNFVEKCESLKKKIINYLKSLNQSDKNFASHMLFLCCLVFEMNDRDFSEKVADFLPNTIVLSTEVASDEVFGFYYVLSARSKNIEITFDFRTKNRSIELLKLAQEMLTQHNPVVHFKDSEKYIF